MDFIWLTLDTCPLLSACLSLAELGRRGLLLPHRLPDGRPYSINTLSDSRQVLMHVVGD